MWRTTVGPAAVRSNDAGAHMDKFLNNNLEEFNNGQQQQRCQNNRDQSEFSSEEDDEKCNRFPYPVLDLHKGGTQGDHDESSKLWPASSSRMSPPEAHNRTRVIGSILSTMPAGFTEGSRHHHHHRLGLQQQQEQHDRFTGRDVLGIHNMRINGGGGGGRVLQSSIVEPSSSSVMKGSATGTMKMTRTIKSYHCRMCEQEFENKSDMQRHAKEAHRMEEKGHKCSKCFKSFPSSQQLAQHLLVHSNVRKYPCRFCDKAFKQLSHVQQHQRIHTGERPYQCTVDGCSKAFRQLSSLQQHIKGHNIPLSKSYPIAHSLSTLADVTTVKGGASFGHNDKINLSLARPHDLTCQVCEKHCADEVRFFRHIHKYHPDYWRVFSGGRPLNDFLETRDTMTTSSAVRHHDKLFTCDVCQKSYTNETGYWRHMAMHPGVGVGDGEVDRQVHLYKCLVCKKLFTKEAYLLRHMEMKLDDQHCQGLVELKNNSAMFRVTQQDGYLLPSSMQSGQELMSSNGGDRGKTTHDALPRHDGRDRCLLKSNLMPPRANGTAVVAPHSAYPHVPLNRSLSLDHQMAPYRHIHSPELAFKNHLDRMDQCDSNTAPSPVLLPRLVVCDLQDVDPQRPANSCGSASAISPKASLSRSSSPCSPLSVQSFSYHTADNQHANSGGGRSRGGATSTPSGVRHGQLLHGAIYSPTTSNQTYYSSSKSTGQEMMNHRSCHQSYPQSPGTGGCLPGSPEDQRQRSPEEDQKPFLSSHDYLEPSSPYVPRFQALPPASPSSGARSSPYVMIPPGPFVHPSVMSPPCGAPSRHQQHDVPLRRGCDVPLRRGCDVNDLGLDMFQRHDMTDRGIGDAGSRVTDMYLLRCGGQPSSQGHDVDVYQQQQQRGDVTDAYLHRSDAIERDFNAYLRRNANDISESDVDAFLRRNDFSECYIATALSQLARSIPGFR